MPPPEYDTPYTQELVVEHLGPGVDHRQFCRGVGPNAIGCTIPISPTRCKIYVPHDAVERLVRLGFTYEHYMRHELAHCPREDRPGWPGDHPGARNLKGEALPVEKPDQGRARRLAECKALHIDCYEP